MRVFYVGRTIKPSDLFLDIVFSKLTIVEIKPRQAIALSIHIHIIMYFQ